MAHDAGGRLRAWNLRGYCTRTAAWATAWGGKRRDPPVASGEVRVRRLDAGYRYLAAAHAAALAAARCACAGGGSRGRTTLTRPVEVSMFHSDIHRSRSAYSFSGRVALSSSGLSTHIIVENARSRGQQKAVTSHMCMHMCHAKTEGEQKGQSQVRGDDHLHCRGPVPSHHERPGSAALNSPTRLSEMTRPA